MITLNSIKTKLTMTDVLAELPAFEASGVQATKGHLASNGGLRGHSVGDKFPVVLGMQGSPHNRLYWFAQAPDGAEMLFPSYEAASEAADAWHMLRRSFTGKGEAVGITYEIRKVVSNEDEDGNTDCESFDLEEDVKFDFFGLYATNSEGFSEWIADSGSALALGRITAFLVRAMIKEEYTSLQVNARQGGTPLVMTLPDFYNMLRGGFRDSNADDYNALDTAMSERLGYKLWLPISAFY